jgi:prepilin-type N-terminal cleavage/methylation domain-containing protein
MKSEKGFSLVEVIIAICLMGIVGIAYLGGMSTASNLVFHADERATAESLARTQMEYVKNQAYIDYSVTGHALYQKITPPSGYTIDDISVTLLDPKGDGNSNDDGIQKITVVVKFPSYDATHTNRKVTLEGYKLA